MKTFSRQRIINLALALGAIVVFSSCNRGYGCPTNFSINDWLIDTVKVVITTLF